MNILFVSYNFPPMDGGISRFDYHVCQELFGRGHKVCVIANKWMDSEDFDRNREFRIRRLKRRIRPSCLEAIYKVLSVAVKEKIDVIFYGHFGSTHWLSGTLVQRIVNVPYLILIHGTEFNAYFHRFTRIDHWASGIVLRKAKRIIVNSRSTKKLVENHGYSSERINIVHPGTDPVSFKPEVQQWPIINQFGLKDKKVLLSASRLVAKKNHKNVLKALPSVLKTVNNLMYLIIGKGEEEERLIKLTKGLGLEKHVRFIGYIEPKDMPMYYNLCDIFVMPSKTIDIDYESFGIVYAEANACGKPVIGGRSGGVIDAVIVGVTGLLVDPDNVEGISQAIIHLMTDKVYAKKLGENGRRRVEQELNWPMVGRKIEEILEKATTQKC